jgi:hypothetical protein
VRRRLRPNALLVTLTDAGYERCGGLRLPGLLPAVCCADPFAGLLRNRLVVKTTAARLMNSAMMVMREKDSQQIEQGIFPCHLPDLWLRCHEKPIGNTLLPLRALTDAALGGLNPGHLGEISLRSARND